MKQSNIIEPCCINTQLPELLKKAKRGVFFSNGDWGVKKLMQAVSFLVEKDATVVLLMPKVDVYFCRMIREWFGREWMDCLVLATQEDCSALMTAEFVGYEDRVLYCHRKNLSTEAFIRYNDHQRLALFGPMRMEGDRTFCQYSYVHRISPLEFGEALRPIVSLFVRVKKGAKGKVKEFFEMGKNGFNGSNGVNGLDGVDGVSETGKSLKSIKPSEA